MIQYQSSYYGIVGLGEDYIAHFGTKGSKWGVRRYQNEDGSYTAAGAANGGRYAPKNTGSSRKEKRLAKYYTKETAKLNKRYGKQLRRLDKKVDKLENKYNRAADRGASNRKLNRIANRYEKAATKRNERDLSKAAEYSKIEANSTNYKAMKRERRSVRRKARHGALMYGALGGNAIGAAIWQGARRGKYKERVRISKSARKQINRTSAVNAAYSRAELERKKIKRR